MRRHALGWRSCDHSNGGESVGEDMGWKLFIRRVRWSFSMVWMVSMTAVVSVSICRPVYDAFQDLDDVSFQTQKS